MTLFVGQRQRLEYRQQILLDRELAKDRGFLRQIADTAARTLIQRQHRDVVATQGDGAGVGPQQAYQHVEGSGLAGAVGPEQPDHFALADVYVDVVDDDAAAIALGQAVPLKRGFLGGRSS